jgi:hypothetical protein
MNRVILENTYGYEDFITEDERLFLEEWAILNNSNLKRNSEGPYRNFGRLDSLPETPKLIKELKNKLIGLESIEKVIEAPQNADWLGVQKETAFVEPHMDYNGPDRRYYTRRYNILISLPEEGGQPIYGSKVLNVKEKMIWRCDAGLVIHSSIPNKGKKPRINLSFGFLMPRDGHSFETKLM